MSEDINYLEMSDSDFLALADTEDTPETITDSEATEGTGVAEEGDKKEEINTETTNEDTSDSRGEDANSGEELDTDEPDEEGDTSPDDADGDTEEASDEDDSKIDYEAFHKQVTAEFKARGKKLSVSKAEDIIRLMEMGSGFSSKMAEMKPNLKFIKMLENNQLLDEDKLGFLIDLNNKSPNAISKLLQESKLDPLDINLDDAKNYQAADHSVHDSQINLDSIVADIKDTPTYPEMIRVVTREWDTASKQVVSGEPQLLQVINSHMESGIYDKISTQVAHEKMLGRLVGMSDIEAYQTVGDAINAQGGFKEFVKQTPETAPRQQPKSDGQGKVRNAKRKAAKSTKAKPSKSESSTVYLDMSDEDFIKEFGNSLS